MKIITAQDTTQTGGHDHKHLICRATEADFKPRKLIIPTLVRSGSAPVKDEKHFGDDQTKLDS